MTTKPKILDFVSKGPKKSGKDDDGVVIDHGKIGSLDYEVYKRGAKQGSPILVLHIFNSKMRFKKDADVFEDELDKIDFDKLDERHVIKGSGDNDDLVLMLKDGDVVFDLTKKGLTMINKVKDILSKNRKKESL
jgi:hypothetical protein